MLGRDQIKSLAEHFKCPILRTVMKDPVIAADGHTYERAAIESWIERRGARAISPLTGEPLVHHELQSNFAFKKMIEEYKSNTSQRNLLIATERDIELAIKLREEELNELLNKQRSALANVERERDEAVTQIGPMAKENIRLKEEIAILRATDSSSTVTGFTITASSTESAATPITEQNILSPHLSQLETQYKNLLQHHSANVIKRAIASHRVHHIVKNSDLHKQKTDLLDQGKILTAGITAEEEKRAQRIQALEAELNQQLERIKRELIASIEDNAKIIQLIEERLLCRSKCDAQKQILNSELNQTIGELKRAHEEALSKITRELGPIESEQQLKKSSLTKWSVRIAALTGVISQQYEFLSSNLELQKKQRKALVSDITDFAAESNKKSLIIDERLNTIIRRLDKRSSPLVLLTKAQQLALAAQKGHLSRVQRLLQEGGVRIDEKDEAGKTALLCAAQGGHLFVVQWLLREGGAHIDEKTNRGNTALLYAAAHGHLSVVQWLLREDGACIDENNAGMTALLYAVLNGHLPVVQWLLQEGGARIDEKDKNGNTALLWAALNGHLPVVQWLLRKGGARIGEKDKDGNTALLRVAQKGHLPVVQWLLREGDARIDEKNTVGLTALLCSACNGHLPVVQWLLQEGGARIDEKDKDGSTALLYAAAYRHLPVVQWLLQEGGASIDEKDKDGDTALLCAAQKGHLPVVQWLLREGGARIDEKSTNGYTALLWSARDGHLPIVQWLLQEGGARIGEMDNRGRTALSIARSLRHTDVADYLATFQASRTTNRNPQPSFSFTPFVFSKPSPAFSKPSPVFFKPGASNAISAATPVVSASPKLIPKLPSPQGMTFK